MKARNLKQLGLGKGQGRSPPPPSPLQTTVPSAALSQEYRQVNGGSGSAALERQAVASAARTSKEECSRCLATANRHKPMWAVGTRRGGGGHVPSTAGAAPHQRCK
jgi:hypothetical protein